LRTLEELGLAHTIRLGDRHAVGVAEGPIEAFLDAKTLGNPKHQSCRPGDQRRQQRMEESTGLFHFVRVDRKTLAVRSEASQFFRGVQIGDNHLDKDSVARRIGQNLEGLLLAIERIPVQSRRFLEPYLDGCAQIDQALKKSSFAGSTR
jgi:hypothetical protein